MDYQIVYNIVDRKRTISGKCVNVRKCIGETHAKDKFKPWARDKHGYEKTIKIVELNKL